MRLILYLFLIDIASGSRIKEGKFSQMIKESERALQVLQGVNFPGKNPSKDDETDRFKDQSTSLSANIQEDGCNAGEDLYSFVIKTAQIHNDKTWFKVEDLSNNEIVWVRDSSFFPDGDTVYEIQECLPPRDYTIKYTYWTPNEDDRPTFTLHRNGEILFDKPGHYGLWNGEYSSWWTTTVTIKIPSSSPSSKPSSFPSSGPSSKPSSFPSSAPSNKPSSFPSSAPSNKPSNSPSRVQDIQWNIAFGNVDANKTNDGTGASIEFDLTYGRLDDIVITYLTKDCEPTSEVTKGTMYELSRNYLENKTNGVVHVGFNSSILTESNIWEETSTSAVVCVRADLTGRSIGYNESIIFVENILTMKYDLTSGFEIEDIALEKFDAATVEKTESFNVGACICNKDSCLEEKKLKQNDQFNVCIYSLSPYMEIGNVLDMHMLQNGEVKFSPVDDDGKANALSEIFLDNTFEAYGTTYNGGAIVTSRVISAFFASNSPNPLTIKGNVKLDFVTEQRNLKERGNDNPTEDGSEQPFQLDVSLIPPGDKIAVSDEKATFEDGGMLGIISIIAGAVFMFFVGAFVYIMRFKK